MPPASVIVPSFIQGVSTQADTQKIAASAKSILNGYPDIAVGLRKRSPTKFQFQLSVTAAALPYSYHWINSGSARFIMFITQDATEPIQIFNILTGVKSTVAYGSADAKAYVNAGSGNERWRVLSVFDSTFVLNQTVVTALEGAATTYTVASTLLEISELFESGTPVAGSIYKTLNSTVGRPAGFYQAKTPYSASDADNFVRLKSPAALSDINPDTMPVQLLYDSGTNTFNVGQPNWRSRFSGDEVSNPGPSFIGRKLTDMVFHKNRLWFFADETVVSSRAGSFFNFWIDDISNLTSADPIDEFVTDEGLNKILFAVPFSESLILLTEGSRQFEVRSVGPMAPDSVSIIPTTDYGVDPQVRPVRSGNAMYFMTPFNNYGQMMEYYYIENAASNIAEDVSEHVKGFIAEEIRHLSPDVNTGLLVTHGDNATTLYPYRVKWAQNQKTQSAWVKWDIPDTGHKIVSSTVIEDQLWLLLKVVGVSTTRYVLASMNIEADNSYAGLTYPVHLDMFVNYATGTYDAGTNTTYWDLPYSVGDADPVVIRLEGLGIGLAIAATTTEQSEHVTRVTVDGNLSTTDVVIGLPYEYRVELNNPYVKSQDGVVRTGNFSMQKLILYIRNAVQFTMSLATVGISVPYRATYSAVQNGSVNTLLNSVPVADFDDPSFIVLGKGTESDITISDTSEFPLTLVSAEFRGNFSPRRSVR